MSGPGTYTVLARKYRPATFADLIGQDAMVRTLKNAFEADRIAQAFILTGIRGTGKTTTARIIAKGMNCVGPEGTGGPTTDPCGICEPCRAIAEGRHVDVLEMDAASRTGVGDIREIIESVAYRAASARFKVYIIDEVHMLSTSAFNALLKTLEEPPEHVKFVFATTEIRKVPVTVLSRCQRFDLRRIEPEIMLEHLEDIATKEGAKVDRDALGLIVRAAEGSVRDALSLLDQAIAHGDAATSVSDIRGMLGLADRSRVLDLFEMVMRGDASGALAELSAQYADGADPLAVMSDLAEITHWLSVAQITPDALDDPTVPQEMQNRGSQLKDALPQRVLARTWQMLIRSLDEIASAPNAMMAAEMALIRLTHVADLPTPEDLVRRLRGEDRSASAQDTLPQTAPSPAPPPSASLGAAPLPRKAPGGGAAVAAVAHQPTERALARFATFDQVVALIRSNRDMQLLIDVQDHVRLADYAPGRIEFEPGVNAPADLAARLSRRLQGWTGVRWQVSVVRSGGKPSISEARQSKDAERKTAAMGHPLVKSVFAAFPDARITAIKTVDDKAAEAERDALADAEDDWDPFEED